MRRIVTIKELSIITGLNRSRLHRLISEERLKPDMIDIDSHMYWTPAHARSIAKQLREQREARPAGPGNRIVIE
jgi:hypothetical protein